MQKIKSASLKIGKVIHDELLDIIDVYPVVAPENTQGTFAIYRRNSLKVSNTKDIFDCYETADIELVIVSKTYTEGIDLAITIKFYLEHLQGEYTTSKEEKINIHDITLKDCREEWSNNNYIQILSFSVLIYNEPDEN